MKEVDKGSNVFILNKTLQKILKEETGYKLIDTNIDNNIISKITKFYKIHDEKQTKKKRFLN